MTAAPTNQFVERSHRITLGNRDDALRLLDSASEPDNAVQLMNVNDRKLLFAFLDEVDRRLANYLGALYSLSKHVPGSVDPSYRKHALRCLRIDVVAFALFVRDYGVHDRPPISMANLGVRSDSPTGAGPPFALAFGPVLVVADLVRSKAQPKEAARRYMSEHSENVPVRDVVVVSGAAVEASLALLGET